MSWLVPVSHSRQPEVMAAQENILIKWLKSENLNIRRCQLTATSSHHDQDPPPQALPGGTLYAEAIRMVQAHILFSWTLGHPSACHPHRSSSSLAVCSSGDCRHNWILHCTSSSPKSDGAAKPTTSTPRLGLQCFAQEAGVFRGKGLSQKAGLYLVCLTTWFLL